MIHLKNFVEYTPTDLDKVALQKQYSVLFIRSAEGIDWYDSIKTFSEGTQKLVYNADGIIISDETDASRIFPVGMSVVEVASTPEGFALDGGWMFDGKAVVKRPPSKEELISEATAKKESLMKVADARIAILQDSVDIGEATQEETAEWKKWKKYRIQLNQLDLTLAPDIVWPVVPA